MARPLPVAPKLPLVPGRECGTCNACCVALTIRDPALNKPQGIRCQHAAPDNRCSIYDTRPQTCRTFHCGWRHLGWVREAMRPDRSGVLVRLLVHNNAARVVFTILEESGLAAEGVAESMAAAVMAGVPLFLEVPGSPGHTAGIAQVNAVLEDVVRRRDKPGMIEALHQCWSQGREGKGRRIVMD